MEGEGRELLLNGNGKEGEGIITKWERRELLLNGRGGRELPNEKKREWGIITKWDETREKAIICKSRAPHSFLVFNSFSQVGILCELPIEWGRERERE